MSSDPFAQRCSNPPRVLWHLRVIGCASFLGLSLVACGGGSTPAGATARVPHLPEPLPAGDSASAALDAFGRQLYAAVASSRWNDVLFDDRALDALLEPSAANRVTTVQRAVALSVQQRELWNAAAYAGICVQQGRLEPAAGPVGLRAVGFLFERALLIGREPGGGPIAGWVEGRFLNTDAGFGALQIERVETPRRDHSDLELQVCELRVLAGEHNHW